jgi:mono/diheme cytochrome c family protein
MRRIVLLLVCVWATSLGGATPDAAAPRPRQCLANRLGAGSRQATLQARQTSPAIASASTASFNADTTEHQALVTRYCATCHNQRMKAGDLLLDAIDLTKVSAHRDVWEPVVRKLRTGTMPPAGMPRPDEAAAARFATWLETRLDADAPAQPGRPLLRRLNRAEYGAAIRDLLALDVDTRALLPADDSAFGFDNIGDLQVVSPALLERYLVAADRVSALAVGDPATDPGSETYRVKGDQSQSRHLEGLPLGTVGGLAVRHTFPLDAVYEFKLALVRTNLEAIRGLEHPHQVEIAVDGQRLLLNTVGGPGEVQEGKTITERSDAIDARLRVRAPIKAGSRVVTATFVRKIAASTNRLRPFLRSNAGTYDATGRPHVESVTVTGPYEATGPGDTASRQRIFMCRPTTTAQELPPASAKASARSRRSSPDITASEDGCANRILSTLARRAYRRPVTEADMTPVLAFYRDGRRKGTFETGIQLGLRRLLASPSFVFRVEADPAALAAGTPYRISDIELASRLSFFLWSSIPDDELIDVAVANRLHLPAVLDAQVRRMLADPKAGALVDNFASQWLHVRNLQNIAPNSDEFPDFDNDLRDAFRREIELFFGSVINEDRNVLDLMRADYTFVNERLAKHYGVPHVYGSQFRRVVLPDDARRGLLGKGSILLATSHADRTAPTLRGKWVLENLLGVPPPPPPPDVPGLEPQAGVKPRTMRERMQVHRASPSCASCHRTMDALGFAMENFNAVGAARTRDAGAPVDASGAAADGTPVNGIVELREAMLRRPEIFVGTLAEKLMTYAIGRGLQPSDMPAVRAIVRNAKGEDYRFSALVLGVVRSAPFQMRQKAGGS